jgi:hypothetical protein
MHARVSKRTLDANTRMRFRPLENAGASGQRREGSAYQSHHAVNSCEFGQTCR